MTGRQRERPDTHEGATDITTDELREFLEADRLGVRGDPRFKERLRRRLWEIVRLRTPRGTRNPDDA